MGRDADRARRRVRHLEVDPVAAGASSIRSLIPTASEGRRAGTPRRGAPRGGSRRAGRPRRPSAGRPRRPTPASSTSSNEAPDRAARCISSQISAVASGAFSASPRSRVRRASSAAGKIRRRSSSVGFRYISRRDGDAGGTCCVMQCGPPPPQLRTVARDGRRPPDRGTSSRSARAPARPPARSAIGTMTAAVHQVEVEVRDAARRTGLERDHLERPAVRVAGALEPVEVVATALVVRVVGVLGRAAAPPSPARPMARRRRCARRCRGRHGQARARRSCRRRGSRAGPARSARATVSGSGSGSAGTARW